MFSFRSLSNMALSDLVTTINEAFSDYIISLHMSEVSLAQRFKQYNVDLDMSVGCFVEETCVGFVINMYEQDTLYNTMTGVIPSYRGQKIFTQMLAYMDETFQVPHAILEVICENQKAVTMYTRNGFEIIDTLHVLRFDQGYQYTKPNHFMYPGMHIIKQSFGNTPEALNRIRDTTKMHLLDDARCYIQENGNIVLMKTQSINAASLLIVDALKDFPSITMQNISETETELLDTYYANGAQCVLKQYLMKRTK